MRQKFISVSLAQDGKTAVTPSLDFIPDEVIIRHVVSAATDDEDEKCLGLVECASIQSTDPLFYYMTGTSTPYELRFKLGYSLPTQLLFRRESGVGEVVVITMEFVKYKPVLGQN